MIAGAFTPSEIVAAWREGAAAVKLFPASVAGPSFVRVETDTGIHGTGEGTVNGFSATVETAIRER
jgi:hypothetical protein